MPIKHPCFVSYAHGRSNGKMIESFMKELQSALASELEAYFDEGLWIDREKLGIGDALDDSLRQDCADRGEQITISQLDLSSAR